MVHWNVFVTETNRNQKMQVNLQKTLSSSLLNFLDIKYGCDVTFSVKGQIFSAHRLVLAQSEVFKSQFGEHADFQQPITVSLPVDYESFVLFVRILYEATVQVPVERISDILHLASHYAIDGLTTLCRPIFLC